MFGELKAAALVTLVFGCAERRQSRPRRFDSGPRLHKFNASKTLPSQMAVFVAYRRQKQTLGLAKPRRISSCPVPWTNTLKANGIETAPTRGMAGYYQRQW
jgi:hypothetical protein